MSLIPFFLRHELRLTFRSWEAILSVFFVVLLLVLVISFSLGANLHLSHQEALAFIWIPTLMGSPLKLARTFESENRGGVLDALRMEPKALFPFFFSKWLFNLATLCFMSLFSVVLISLLFRIGQPWAFFLNIGPSLALGSLGLATIGTTFSGMLSGQRQKELLLTVISFPLFIPLILAVLYSVSFNVGGQAEGVNADWMKILLAFNGLYLVASWLSFDLILENS